MKKVITLAILMLISIITQLVFFLPWWSFLAPVFVLGIVLPLEKWKITPFLFGFIAGFAVWLLSTLYFEVIYKGEIMHKMSKMIDVPNYLTYMIIGSIGGILTGLALYSGFLLRRGREKLHLELPEN